MQMHLYKTLIKSIMRHVFYFLYFKTRGRGLGLAEFSEFCMAKVAPLCIPCRAIIGGVYIVGERLKFDFYLLTKCIA